MDSTNITAPRPGVVALATRTGLARRRSLRGLIGLFALLLALSAAGLWAPTRSFANSSFLIGVNTTNWTPNGGYGSTSPFELIDNAGVVHLAGSVKQVATSSGSPTLIGTLPTGHPNRNVFTIAHTYAGTYTDLSIDTAGKIWVIAPPAPFVTDFSFLSLDGVSFYPGTGTPFPVNTTNWSPNAGYGSTPPAYFVDSSHPGFVHLQGAVKQVPSSSGSPTLIGTLPASLLPCATNLYMIVHTYAGTYADLSIDTAGKIWVIAARPPQGYTASFTNLSFLSLEGLSFKPCYPPVGSGLFGFNTTDWSYPAGYGSNGPGYNDDSNGIVHLAGAVKLVAKAGNWTWIGAVEYNAVPGHTVYTIVHTFAGTYADLSIDTSGNIWVLVPRAPAVTDLSFLSLDSVSYLVGY